MFNQIYIAGFPTLYESQIELIHNIILWRSYNIEVHIVPLFDVKLEIQKFYESLGCIIDEYNRKVFKGKIVVSFNNSTFLDVLEEIKTYSCPKHIIWFNCTYNTSSTERYCHRKKLIDYYGFASDFQEKNLKLELEIINPVKKFEGYKPFFDIKNPLQSFKFQYKRIDKCFNIGRASINDVDKFSIDMWKIYFKVCSPVPTKTFILGYDNLIEDKVGIPLDLDYSVYSYNEISLKDFYSKLHVLIYKTDKPESFSRTPIEAILSGVVPIVQNDSAYKTIIEDGINGFKCSSSDEMSYKASLLAFDKELYKKMVFSGYKWFKSTYGNPENCIKPWLNLFN